MRAVSFIDGQNLYHGVREAFGVSYPNFDPLALSRMICQRQGWELIQVRFYTGIPDPKEDEFWHTFWSKKIAQMKRNPLIWAYSRPLRYAKSEIPLSGSETKSISIPREKGIDIRIALDITWLARENEYDTALLFSQDQDFSEVAAEIRKIAQKEERDIKNRLRLPAKLELRKPARGKFYRLAPLHRSRLQRLP